MGVPTTPGSLAGLSPAWRAFLAEAPLGDSTFLDVAEQQLRFRVAQYPSGAARVHTDSAFTRALVEDPATRERVERLSSGVLEYQRAMGPGEPQPFRGFSFARSEDGEVANRALHGILRSQPPTAEKYVAALERARAHLDRTVAVRVGPWIHLGAERSAGIVGALEGAANVEPARVGAGVKTMLHEIRHVADPRPVTSPHLDWFSEGKAEALARWNGQVESAAARFGLVVPPGVGAAFDISGPYQKQVSAFRQLVAATGVRLDDPAAYETANQLTTFNTPAGVEHVMASAIAQNLAHPGASVADIRAGVLRLFDGQISPDGESADPAVVERFVTSVREAGGRTGVPTR